MKSLTAVVSINQDRFIDTYFKTFAKKLTKEGLNTDQFVFLNNGEIEEVGKELCSALENVTIEFDYWEAEKPFFNYLEGYGCPGEPAEIEITSAYLTLNEKTIDISDYKFEDGVQIELEEKAIWNE